ncbi:ArsR/SmtB family transcription factor [Hydrogenophaga flava]|uniref:ArsR/SmtB family transcription factor n=1 Tax=Hydrogenophaga flava TaxID=65657 RepID=UPI0008271565|nr:helix-turn-helix domain-containing protein [Hydrogenophaga flava]
MESITPAEQQALSALTALSQVVRLRAFRELVVAGPAGMTPGAIAERLDVAPSSLSFHLKELVHADLVSAEPQGRNLIYRAHFDRMNALLGYLTEHCCGGQACEVAPSACSDCGDPT